MKNILNYLSIIALLFLASCAKKLDKEPLALQVDQNFYKTNEDMIEAVNAAYDPLGWESTNKNTLVFFNFIYGDIASDDANKGGDEKGEPAISPIAQFYVNSTDPGLLQVWKKLYIGIYRANVVIEKAPVSDASAAIKARVIGEAKFLRAYYYFNLIRMFGDVPLITEVTAVEKIIRPKSSKSVVYQQIEADLKDAAGSLPPSYTTEKGRATKGAANGLLARVYLFQANWPALKNVTDEIIGSGKYKLEADYAKIHSLETENGDESLFELQATSTNAGDDDHDRLNEGTYINKFMKPRGEGQMTEVGWGVNVPSDELVDLFKAENSRWNKIDPRFKATVISEGDSVFVDGKGFKISFADAAGVPLSAGVKYYCRKYLVDKIPGTFTNGPSNQRVIRYADVLLMAAEAAFMLGDEPKAREYVNLVRFRAFKEDKYLYSTAITIDDIWKERRLELAMEGLRFFDIVRQGKAADWIKPTTEGKLFRAGVNEVFPIPQAEIDLTGGVLTQNPGY